MRFLRTLLSPSHLIAVLALVVACGGSAWAGTTLLGGSQVRDGSLTGIDVRNGSIGAADLASTARGPKPRTISANELGFGPLEVHCAAGEMATGGGGTALGLQRSEPLLDANGVARGWVVEGNANAAPEAVVVDDGDPGAITDYAVTAHVICVRG